MNEKQDDKLMHEQEEVFDDSAQIKRIEKKNLFVRVVAAVIDFTFAALVGLLVGVFSSNMIFVPIANQTGLSNQDQIKEVSNKLEKEEGNSHLFAPNPNYETDTADSRYLPFNDNAVKENYDTYIKYQDELVKYYTIYLSSLPENGGAIFNTQEILDNNVTNHLYTTYWYNVFMLGQDDVLHYYSTEALNERDEFIVLTGKTYFTYDGENYDSLAKVKDEYYVSEDRLKEEAEEAIFKFYNTTDKKDGVIKKTYEYVDAKGKTQKVKATYYACLYERAIAHWIYEAADLTNENSIFAINNYWSVLITEFNKWQTTYPVLAGIVVAWIIMYFLIPALAKDGRTLGKMIFKEAVVNKLDYSITVPQLLLRSLTPLAIIVILYIVGMNTTMVVFWISMLVVVMSSFALMIFTKKHQAIHDFIAATRVVDSDKSVWFKNKDQEDAYQKMLEDKTNSL